MKVARKCWPFAVLFVMVVGLACVFLSWRPIPSCLTVRGTIAYLVEATCYEDLVDAAAFRHTPQVTAAANRIPCPTVAAFAAKYPQYVRPGAKVGEPERQEGAIMPPPLRANVAPVAR